jgi:hypothetical protein
MAECCREATKQGWRVPPSGATAERRTGQAAGDRIGEMILCQGNGVRLRARTLRADPRPRPGRTAPQAGRLLPVGQTAGWRWWQRALM